MPAKTKSPARPSPATGAEPFDPARLRGGRLLVVGDILLDRYIWGEVERLSPEAPVPVVLEKGQTDALGGALNVARNVVVAGGEAVMAGVLGADDNGGRILAMMDALRLGRSAIVADPSRPTTVKTRVISGGQQLMRLDREVAGPYARAIEARLVASVEKAARRCDGVVISDYRKGVVTRAVAAAAIRAGRERGVPVTVDPKARDFSLYRGADWLTPNLKEASEAAGKPLSGSRAVEAEGRKLLAQYGGKGIVITRGHEGLSVIDAGSATHIAARAREVYDVTGAGDTFIAHFALALAAGASPAEAAGLGNAAAGIAVGKRGAATVSPEELAAALGERGSFSKVRSASDLRPLLDQLRASGRRVVLANGCFDLFHSGHIRLLQEARAQGDVLVVALNTDASVRRIKGEPRPILPESERAAILSALPFVDYIVFFEEDTPERLLADLRPDALVKGLQRGKPVVGAKLVKSYGGEVLELPLFEGASTGELVKKLRRPAKRR